MKVLLKKELFGDTYRLVVRKSVDVDSGIVLVVERRLWRVLWAPVISHPVKIFVGGTFSPKLRVTVGDEQIEAYPADDKALNSIAKSYWRTFEWALIVKRKSELIAKQLLK